MRRAKIHISSVRVGTKLITEQRDKEQAFFNAYHALLGSVQPRDYSLHLDNLGIQEVNLEELDGIFT